MRSPAAPWAGETLLRASLPDRVFSDVTVGARHGPLRAHLHATAVGRRREPGLIVSETELSKQHTTERAPRLGKHMNPQHTE